VFVALVIQHAMLMRRIVICGLSDSTVFFAHYLIDAKTFGKTLPGIKYVLISSTNFV
jgi:hypothetical protein